jgi:hypothetical protein
MQSEMDCLLLLKSGKCPICKSRVYIIENEKTTVVKTALIRLSLGENCMYAKCRRCKHWLIIPLSQIGTELTKVS